MAEPIESLLSAMKKSGMGRTEVGDLCQRTFGVSKFSELRESQQWTLICQIDPTAIGPYGHSMEPF